MDATEKGAIGVAAAGHVVLFGLLSVGFLATPNPALLKRQPVEVVLAEDIGLTSAAPDPSTEVPAERLAEVEGPVTATTPPPAADPAPPTPEVTPAPMRPSPPPPRPSPAARPRPTPPPAASARPAPRREARPAPARPAPPSRDRARPTGRLTGIVDGINDRPSASSSTRARTQQSAAQARRSITVAIGQEVRPYWRPPTGADAEQLVTVLQFDLNPDGTLAGRPRVIEQRGKTDSNAPQQALHAERAIRAVVAGAPFSLPREYYEQWKTWRLDFDARLN